MGMRLAHIQTATRSATGERSMSRFGRVFGLSAAAAAMLWFATGGASAVEKLGVRVSNVTPAGAVVSSLVQETSGNITIEYVVNAASFTPGNFGSFTVNMQGTGT